MIQALFGEIKGVFGKTFILAGLLPAMFVLLSLTLFYYQLTGLDVLIRSLLVPTDKLTVNATLLIASWLALGLFFFAARRFFVDTFQALPWPGLGPLRRYMLRTQIRRYKDAIQTKAEALYDMTAGSWYKEAFGDPKYAPASIAEPSVGDACRNSGLARDAVKEACQHPGAILSDQAVRIITLGLRQLHRSGVADTSKTEYQDEIRGWKTVTEASDAKRCLDLIVTDANRRFLDAVRLTHRFPANELWMQPTRFGNRMAALDDYAEQRYHIDTTTLWHRLWGILSNQDRNEVSDARLSIEILLNLTVAMAAIAFITLMTGLIHLGIAMLNLVIAIISGCLTHQFWANLQIDWYPSAFGCAFLVFALITYNAALYSTASLSDAVVRLIDLHRLRLLAVLGFPCPATVRSEVNLFEQLQEFFTQGIALHAAERLRYPPAANPVADEDKRAKSK